MPDKDKLLTYGTILVLGFFLWRGFEAAKEIQQNLPQQNQEGIFD